MTISKAELLASLPPPWPENLSPAIRRCVTASRRKVVVLDDDPTGTQTVYDVPVLTQWDCESLHAEFVNDLPCFYVLTNSRSLAADAARSLSLEIARNLTGAAAAARRKFVVVSRSDSTLRGHFPLETDALEEVLGPFDATILIPYFEAGGRYTIRDIQYVAEEDTLVPAAETPFARDAAFGYSHSNLREWIEEKTAGRIRAEDVHSFSISELRPASSRTEPSRAATVKLLGLPRGSFCVVNACHPRDLELFALASMFAEQAGARFLYRTAAQFVSARLGLEPRQLLTAESLSLDVERGGLTVVGSHVPKTTEQLDLVLRDEEIECIELRVAALMASKRSRILAQINADVTRALIAGRDVVLFTSRNVITGRDAQTSLGIGQQVSAALVEIIRRLEVRPRYFVAKGGITSSDVATKGLGVKRAVVLGQILPGVPVWELGAETRFPGLPYVVFPGNVGERAALREVVQKLRR